MSSVNFVASTSRQSAEFAPEIRSAGKVCTEDEVHVAELTSHYNADVCETPDKIKAFSHRGPNVGEIKQNRWSSYKNNNSATHESSSFNRQHNDAHYADKDNEHVDICISEWKENGKHYTRKTSKDHDTVEKCLRPDLYANKMTALIEAQRQLNYLSERRKPLGRTPAPSFKVITPVNGFGKNSSTNCHHHHEYNDENDKKEGSSTTNTKSNMNNESNGVASAINAWRDVEPMYLPGEPYDREYDWERMKIDPTTYRFGVNKSTSLNCSNGASSVFPPASHAVNDDLILVPKLVCDYYKTTSSEIGKSKPGLMNYTSKTANISVEQTQPRRKMKTQSDNQLSVRDVLTGWAENKPHENNNTETVNTNHNTNAGTMPTKSNNKSEQFQSYTSDYGKSQVSKLSDHSRSIPTNEMKDDVTAEQLLHPCNYVQLGVESKYFAGARSLESIRELCHRTHFPLSDDEINHIYRCVIERDGKCGIEQFKNTAVAMGFM